MMMTPQGYEVYLKEWQRIVAAIEENKGDIYDVAEQMEFGDYESLGSLYASEHPEMTERQIARKMAEDQTYYRTPAEAEAFLITLENYYNEMGTPPEERETVAMADLLYGTKHGRVMYQKHFAAIKDYYHALKDAGYSGKEAGRIISKVIFGSP